MRRQMLVLAMGGLLLSACQGQTMTRQDVAAQQQAVQARVTAWAKAFSNRQQDSLAAFYEQSDTFTMAWPDGDRTHSWTEEQAKQKKFFTEARQFNFVLQDPQTEILAPTVAVTTFRHAMDVIFGEVNPERRYFPGQGTLVWTRAKESEPWTIHIGQLSRSPS
jgi:hypothetical protein